MLSRAAGTIATATIAAAYGAAAPYAPAEVAVHSSVARVSTPVGRRMRVAGSSFITLTATRAAPASSPGAISGAVTAAKAPAGVRPSERATCSSTGLVDATAERAAPTATGRNSTT